MPKNRLTADAYVQGIREGNRVLLSRAITLLESNLESDQALALQVLEQVLPYTGSSFRIGITGVPGVGKSTFIETFGNFLTGKGHKVAVLAVDPSSALSKGSILGDKTRMETLARNPMAYIRPSPSSETLGGVANTTRESILLCEAAGYDVILVETVGVGQSETAVKNMCDFFLLLLLAGAGDELQGIKKGIMEMADGVCITKADGENALMAERARNEFAMALHYMPTTVPQWSPFVGTCSAMQNTGFQEVWDQLQAFLQHVKANAYFEKNRAKQQLFWFKELSETMLLRYFYSQKSLEMSSLSEQVMAGKLNPSHAAIELVQGFFKAK